MKPKLPNQTQIAESNLLVSQPKVDGLKILPAGRNNSNGNGICLLIGGKWHFLPAEPIFGKPEADF